MTTRTVGVVGIALLWAAAILPAGCASDSRKGYSFESTFPANVQTVEVPVFENYTFSSGIEAEITEAVVKEIQRATPMRVSQGGSADTRLTGVVTGVEMRRMTLDRTTGLVQELAVQVTVDFAWIDKRSGRTLTERRAFTASDTFVASRPAGERLEVGQRAAVQRLARDIVSEMRSAW